MISDILRDHGTGKGINGTDKQVLIDLVNAADKNQSVVKTNIATSLNAVSTDKSLGLSAASTWVDIQSAIPQVKTGKKWSSGTGSSDSNLIMTVTGLAFKPSVILIQLNPPTVNSNEYTGIFASKSLFGSTLDLNFITSVFSSGAVHSSNNACTLNANGFTMAVGSVNRSYKWIAFE